jgi:hypothetical protein
VRRKLENSKPTAHTVMALDLCISDVNKLMLLSNERFLPYVVDALLLDPDHPQASQPDEIKTWCQAYRLRSAPLLTSDQFCIGILYCGACWFASDKIAIF